MVASGWILLVTGAVWFAFSYNAVRPHYTRAFVAVASFFAGWLRSELALPMLLVEVPLFGLLIWEGALHTWPGGVGMVLHGAAIALLLSSLQTSYVSRTAVDEALAGFADDRAGPVKLPWRLLLIPFWTRDARVERLRNRVYHEEGAVRLRVDVYRGRRAAGEPAPSRRPALVFVHGGAWMIGFKAFQGLPMLRHFAALGWVCFSINYRLSPRATFPDHLVDVKRAIAWVRAHADEFGCDPRFIVMSGNSAGGHLASLASLTPNDPALQPGFAEADTSVAACLSFYGIYDFSDRFSHWHNRGLQELLERYVMKARLADAPARFDAASPLSHVGPNAPPFLVVHGDRDSIVPVAEARAFVAALRSRSAAPCVYIEVPGAQHAFEVFPSLRTIHLMRGLERFAVHIHRLYLARAQ
ncbi:MAG TPA: alpha/beta hydrolase [Polyangia bacterium]|nr:alpha/beta hydrolase [Polyangia bacterium]